MIVTLYGGPMDGRTLTFAHGDLIEFPDAPPTIDFSVQSVEPIRRETITYRRSIKNPNIFVFQP